VERKSAKPVGKKSATAAPKLKSLIVVKEGKLEDFTTTVAAVKITKEIKEIKVEKAKKPKLVRDSFTIPKVEYLAIEALKQRANQLSRPVKKSELLRAGLKALLGLSDAAFLTALAQVPIIKTGRPVSV
jgi:hypothetical protein